MEQRGQFLLSSFLVARGARTGGRASLGFRYRLGVINGEKG